MKISLSGKGGVGKTTLAALFTFSYLRQGKSVLAVDADPDGNLGQSLGVPDYKKIVPIIEMKELIMERTGSRPGETGGFFKMNPRVDDIPDKFSWQNGNLKLIIMGGIKKAGAGCACPENVFLKNLLQHLILDREEIVILDMPAGLEHLGRATAKAVDIMMVVVEPGQKSIDSGQRIIGLAQQLGLKKIKIIANKLRSEADKEFIKNKFNEEDILGFIPFQQEILDADRENKACLSFGEDIDSEIEKIVAKIRR